MTMTETNEMTQKKLTSPPPPPLSHKCALTEMETRQVLPGSIRTHMTFPSGFQTTVWKHQGLCLSRRGEMSLRRKNSEVVLINLFYNKVYKTLFFYKTLGFVSDCLSCVTTVFMSVQLKFCTAFNLLKRSDFDVTGVKIGQRCECSESASGDLRLYNLASIFT